MAFRKSLSVILPQLPRLPIILCGLVLLLRGEMAGAQIRTRLVSPVPGNPVASGTVLRNALAAIPSPSATSPWLLKIEPGIYDTGTTPLLMRSWVDMEGSGMGVTIIRGSVNADPNSEGTIQGADNSELRLLTVEAKGNIVIAMSNFAASPRLYRVRFSTTSAGSGWGVRNRYSGTIMEECEINVSAGVSTPLSFAYGVSFRAAPPQPIRGTILRSKISVSGARNNYGIFMADAQTVTLIRDSQIDVMGGQTSAGIIASTTSWLSQEILHIRNTAINSTGASAASYGIFLQAGTWVGLDITASKIEGRSAPETYGILQAGFAPSLVIQGSSVAGLTQTVQTLDNASIASTLLDGGPVSADGTLSCMGVWDEDGIFYAQKCP